MNTQARKTMTVIAVILSILLLALTATALRADGMTAAASGRHQAIPAAGGFYEPNKVWVRKGADGVWQMITDPDHTNSMGADNNAFLNGEEVAAAISMAVPPLNRNGEDWLQITDDWTKVDRYLDPQDVSTVRIYDLETYGYNAPSFNGINVDGRDVTAMFDITVDGTVTRATAKPEYVQGLKQRHESMQISMLVPFTVNFDPEADLEQDGVSDGNTCSDGQWELRNKADASFHRLERLESNEPLICILRPGFDKDVLASKTEGGDLSSIDGRDVLSGQTVTYRLGIRVEWMRDDPIQQLEFLDTYDARTTPDRTSLTITSRGQDGSTTIPRSAYDTEWDDAGHRFTVRFHREWLDGNWTTWRTHEFTLTFDAKVADDAAVDTVIGNKGWLTLNESILESNEVSNRPVDPEPVKQDTQADSSVDIDGKTALLGDRLYYRITIDATGLAGQAYPVRRLGVVDDYDERRLTLDMPGVQVLDATGQDVTDRLNIQDRDGVVYAFFKTVDTTMPDGTVINGDPQPADLAAYADRELMPYADPGIDQSLLGSDYQLVLPMTVTDTGEGTKVENKATQVTNHRRAVSNTVVNTLTEINPYKDVSVEVGSDSADGMSIYRNQTFLYQLNSSTLPANRAYPEVTEWRIDDDYDETGDEYTGQWAVYAAEDLHGPDGGTLAAKGVRIAGSGFDAAALGGDLFTLDMRDGDFTITATRRYLDLVSDDGAHAQAWRAYVQFRRLKAGEFSNTFTETINGTRRPSNEVTTTTPKTSPSISLEKFDRRSGLPAGDRDSTEDALEIEGDGTEIVFRIANTGDMPLTSLKLTDETIVGDGTVGDLVYPDGWSDLVLQPGESVDVTGTLSGVTNLHTDRATAEGSPVVACVPKDDNPFDNKPAPPVEEGTVCTDTPVESDPDDWNAYRKRILPSTGVNVSGLAAVGVILALLGLGLLRIRRDGDGRH